MQNQEKWLKLPKDHHYWKNPMVGTIFSYNQYNSTWYNMKGNVWNGGNLSEDDINYWKTFGFQDCTKEEAFTILKILPKDNTDNT